MQKREIVIITMAKRQISLRITDSLFDKIKTLMEKKNLSMTDAIELIVTQFSEFKESVEFLLELFQQNAPNLEIDDGQKFKAMKIVEMLDNV